MLPDYVLRKHLFNFDFEQFLPPLRPNDGRFEAHDEMLNLLMPKFVRFFCIFRLVYPGSNFDQFVCKPYGEGKTSRPAGLITVLPNRVWWGSAVATIRCSSA